MKLIGIVYIILLVFISNSVFAQKVKLLYSSYQSWSGGIAGRSGSYQNYKFECTDFNSDIIPEKIYIRDEGCYILLCDTVNQGNCIIKHLKNKISITICIATYHDEMKENRFQESNSKSKILPPISFTGVALLQYQNNNKEHYFEIKKFIKTLQPIDYP